MEIKKINWFIPAFLAAYVILLMTVSLAYQVAVNILGIAVPQWILYIAGETITLVVVLIYIFIMKISVKKDMQYKIIGIKDVIMSVLTGYFLVPMILFISNITMLFSRNYLNGSSDVLLKYPYIVQLILIAVIPSLVEEFAFRGLFYGTYRKKSIFKAAIMSGLIFGIFHLNFNQFAYAFIMGVVFSYIVEATGSIWSSVLAHFAVNTYSITVNQILKLKGVYNNTVSAADTQQILSTPVSAKVVSYVIMLVLAAAFMMLAVLCIRNMAKRNKRLDIITKDFRLLKKNKCSDKEKTNNNSEHIVTTPALETVVACVVYMIVMEIIR